MGLCISIFLFRSRAFFSLLCLAFVFLLLNFIVPSVLFAVPPGTNITNTAGVDYSVSSVNMSSVSNSVNVLTLPTPLQGVIFNSKTGEPVNNVEITVINTDTELPATVLSDDGSAFPSTIRTGEPAIDSNGTVYDFADGEYRFPHVAPGNYRYDIAVPAGYTAPSIVLNDELQKLANAPFDIDYPCSYGGVFVINNITNRNIDIPVDPLGRLWLVKTSSKSVVSIGDFIQYRLVIENTSPGAISDIILEDRVPLGFSYQKGSVKIDGLDAFDPEISPDGRNLKFVIDELQSKGTKEIRYVLEVAAGSVIGDAVNTAVAKGGGYISNIAMSTVSVQEELFRDKCIIVGRVIAENCENIRTDKNDGVKGVKIYLEDGSYVVTDENGMYHFEGVNHGLHVVQLDMESLPEKYEPVLCEPNSRFGDTAYSQFVDLHKSTMWRADFHVGPKPGKEGNATISLSSEIKSDTIDYHVMLKGSDVPLKNLRLMVMLPQEIEYLSKSCKIDDKSYQGSLERSGNTLTFRLGDVSALWEKNVYFSARPPAPGEKMCEIVTKAILMFDTPSKKNQRTPIVENIVLIVFIKDFLPPETLFIQPGFRPFDADIKEQEDIEDIKNLGSDLSGKKINNITATGHSDNLLIRQRSHHIYPDNYALSLARAENVKDLLVKNSDNLDKTQIAVLGIGPDQPVVSNDTKEGRALNRRVNLKVVSQSVKFSRKNNIIKGEDTVSVKTEGERPGEREAKADTEEDEDADKMPDYNSSWAESALPGLEWLWPGKDACPSIPSIKIAIMHDPRDKPTLFLEGVEVSGLNFDSIVKNKDKTVAISKWRGVDLHDGDNYFEVVLKDKNNNITGRLKRVVHYSGPPVLAELLIDKSRLVADGLTIPEIAVRLTDKDGKPVRRGVRGEYFVDPPYAAFEDLKAVATSSSSDNEIKRYKYMVGMDGIAMIRLEPTASTGEVVLHLPFMDNEQEMRVWLKPEDRDWILVGLAEGTAGYSMISGNMENAKDADVDNDIYEDGRIAFFAKGMIRGEWLLTMAYDSEKKALDESGLFKTIDPDSYYTLYGDATQQRYDAASARKLYLRIERSQFFALFGDFETGLTITELSRYNRSLNGLKSEFKNEKYSLNLFATETKQAFVKDELRGDGTSGLYRLSRENIVINSEKVVIQTRDRFKSEVILSSKGMSRHTDYNIDYNDGTIFFKEPVYSKDENLNPVFIVIDYESEDSTDKSYVFGGRGAIKLIEDKLEVGATYIHEGEVGGKGSLGGLDAKFKLGKNTEVKAEFASTRRDILDENLTGNACLAEITHRSKVFDGKIYIREQDEDFGLGQQSISEKGMRKIGGEVKYHFTKEFDVDAQLYRQFNLTSDSTRDLIDTKMIYQNSLYGFRTGVRHAEDNFGDGGVNQSDQFLIGASRYLLHKRLHLRADHEQSLGSNNENSDFPTRTILGADFKLADPVLLFAEQEFTFGDDENTTGTRLGMKSTPWAGGSIASSIERIQSENTGRIFGNLGLNQMWRITDKWSIDGGLDQTRTLHKNVADRLNDNVPPASGGEDFVALSLGTGYMEKKWSCDSRIEFRNAETADKWGFIGGIYGEVKKGLGFSTGIQFFNEKGDNGDENVKSDIRFSMAYRPRNTKWIVLDRLDYIMEQENKENSEYESKRIVNNMNVNYKLNKETQVSFYYGLKFVKDIYDGDTYSGFTDLTGIEARYDFTKDWDIGLHTSILHSWNAKKFDYGSGVSFGYKVVKNGWVCAGYNFDGFTDKDFSRGNFTAKGPFVKFRIKFDQESIHEMLRRFKEE